MSSADYPTTEVEPVEIVPPTPNTPNVVENTRRWLEALRLDDLDLLVKVNEEFERAVGVIPQQIGRRRDTLVPAEALRLMDRRLGELVREGQATGYIRIQGQSTRSRAHVARRSPKDFLREPQYGGQIYVIADVPRAKFEKFLVECREEGNLTRANLVRKIEAPTPPSFRKIRMDSNRIVRETVHSLEGLALGLDFVSVDELDPDEIEEWDAAMRKSIRRLNRFLKEMNK